MPIYEYQCVQCGTVADIKHGFKEPMNDACRQCGGALKRLFNAASIVFKGSGFYVTDSRKSNGATGEKSTGDKSAAGRSDGAKSDSGGKSDSATGDSGNKGDSGAKSDSAGKSDSGTKTDSGSKSDSGGKKSDAAA